MSENTTKPRYRVYAPVMDFEHFLNSPVNDGYRFVGSVVNQYGEHLIIMELQQPPPDPASDARIAELKAEIARLKASQQPATDTHPKLSDVGRRVRWTGEDEPAEGVITKIEGDWWTITTDTGKIFEAYLSKRREIIYAILHKKGIRWFDFSLMPTIAEMNTWPRP